MSEVNDIAVTEMFRSYQHEFRLGNLNIIGDNDNKIYWRCLYTREHKLVVINFVLNTWQRQLNRTLEHVLRYYVAKRLRITLTTLG
jgi:hypothetical protein